ncbi:hypothetical protein NDU88_007023 [Pleurodeles waltl]|uniref:GST N-terminal domain-containing protein n=1 Tax=Pleurodeles waltl TaxID=8319 RepID=A0AAV7QQN3_PLEWA|nr:hypothetical protein NDU88_007023 [Pleurodeles waltl]
MRGRVITEYTLVKETVLSPGLQPQVAEQDNRCRCKGTTAHLRGMAASAKALRQGSPAPAKGIKFETININLRSKPEWFLKKAPFGLVPVLETSKGDIIYESLITSDYLDEVYPGKKLTPSDPLQKAKQKMLLEHFSKLYPLMYNALMATRKGQDASELKAEFITKIIEFEEILANKNTPYFGGELVVLKRTPKINSWMELMKQDPAVKATSIDLETMKEERSLVGSFDHPAHYTPWSRSFL